MSKVLVLGDRIVDKYIYGTSTRMSPEAPVPIVTYQNEVTTAGGAGLVYENLKSLGVDVTMLDLFDRASVKTRIICNGHYITRIDNDYVADGSVSLEYVLSQSFDKYDYVILSDYNKGTLEHSVEIIKHINKFDCKVIVDPKTHKSRYKDAWLIKPNYKEFNNLDFADWKGNIIVTNADKSVLARIDNREYNIPVERVEVSDVTGAGDCFLAAFVYALTKKYSYKKSLELAVRGSKESVRHVGTYVLKEKDLQKKIIFTNGCFDILHKGHLTLLKEAKQLGDRLVVGINSDSSVKRLKGNERPINNVATRKEQLLLIPYVDEVIVFNNDTPYDLIEEIQPDLIVKGGDYNVEQVVGYDLAPVHIVPTVDGCSTTGILGAKP